MSHFGACKPLSLKALQTAFYPPEPKVRGSNPLGDDLSAGFTIACELLFRFCFNRNDLWLPSRVSVCYSLTDQIYAVCNSKVSVFDSIIIVSTSPVSV